MKRKSASLDVYRRKPEAVKGEEITLTSGTVVVLRKWGCPQFFEAMQEDDGLIDPEATASKKNIDRALWRWVIFAIYDGENKITDPQAIKKIVEDPLMWEFKNEVVSAASEENRWLVNPELVKNSQASLPPKSSGDEDIAVIKNIGLT